MSIESLYGTNIKTILTKERSLNKRGTVKPEFITGGMCNELSYILTVLKGNDFFVYQIKVSEKYFYTLTVKPTTTKLKLLGFVGNPYFDLSFSELLLQHIIFVAGVQNMQKIEFDLKEQSKRVKEVKALVKKYGFNEPLENSTIYTYHVFKRE